MGTLRQLRLRQKPLGFLAGISNCGQDGQRSSVVGLLPVSLVNLLSYDQLLHVLPGGQRHLLLGNGCSISVHSAFAYSALWPLIRKQLDECEALQEFMDGCENTDVEAALRGILHGNSVEPGTDPEDAETLRKDHYEKFQEAFIRAIAEVHPEFPSDIDNNMWTAFREFLANFNHVFTLNYDLLLYWLNARTTDERWADGFLPGTDGRLRFTGQLTMSTRSSMVFLHGALHFYQEDDVTYKHAWQERGRGIIVQLREGLENHQLPLFVSEGISEHKGEKIAGQPLLAAGLQLLKTVQGTLVTFGASFSDSDRHIARAIALNPSLRCVAIGVYQRDGLLRGETAAQIILEARRDAGLPELEIHFYDTSTVKPWGQHARVVRGARSRDRDWRPKQWVDVNNPYEDDRTARWEPEDARDEWAERRGERWDI